MNWVENHIRIAVKYSDEYFLYNYKHICVFGIYVKDRFVICVTNISDFFFHFESTCAKF